ncbi:MAG: glycosyltransferase family 4 protein [Anaerolineae bacterium]|nr:glycosyltransferase family 4 protein [Anaerolineae bacterium]
MYRIGFVIEQALGHVTHSLNLRKYVPADPEINARWALPAWQTSGVKAKIPIYRSNWTIQAGLQARQTIAKWMQEVPVDGLFFHTQVPAILSQKWLERIPALVSLDATPRQYDRLGAYYEHETGPAWLEQKKWELNVSCYEKAHHLVTWSQWAKQGLVDEYRVPPEKVTVIPPGVDTAEWQRPIPRRYIPGAPIKILFVGANLERKGGHLLLEAFRQVQATSLSSTGNIAELELHLVTQDTVAPESGVHIYNDLQPNTPELRRLFHESDIFCLPTFGDCLPMVLSEAGAAGLPLISTNVAAIPEVVRDRVTGLLVPPHNTEALADALNQLIAHVDLRFEYGQKAKVIVQEAYDVQQNADRLLALLKKTIDEAKTNGK